MEADEQPAGPSPGGLDKPCDTTVARLAAEAFSLVVRACSRTQAVEALQRLAGDDVRLLGAARAYCGEVEELDDALCGQAAELLDRAAAQLGGSSGRGHTAGSGGGRPARPRGDRGGTPGPSRAPAGG